MIEKSKWISGHGTDSASWHERHHFAVATHPKAVVGPLQYLNFVAMAATEHKQLFRAWLLRQLVSDNVTETVNRLAHICHAADQRHC